MEARAVAKHLRMSPRKVRLVVDQIRGVSVTEAYSLLQFSKKAGLGSRLQDSALGRRQRAGEG